MNLLPQLIVFAQEAAPAADAVAYRSPLMYYINQAGFMFGVGIPLLALLLTAVGAVMLAAVKQKAYFVLFLAFAIDPLLLGLYGTLQGYRNIQVITSMSNAQVKPSELAEGYRTAWFTSYVGAFAALPPVALGFAGLAFKGNRRQ